MVVHCLALVVAAGLLAPVDVGGREIVARVREYVDRYRPQIARLVAEERYEQRVDGDPGEHRILVSDWALIRTDDGRWAGFRDVWMVDGQPLPDRKARLERLVGTGALNATTARRIFEESARYNLTARLRTFNSPLVAPELLASDRDWCCRVKARRDPGGRPATWLVEVDERSRPSLVRKLDGESVFSHAQFEVEEAGGVIRRTELRVGDDEPVSLTVEFAPHDELGMWLPRLMTESFEVDGRQASGRAEYTRWRRFAVQTRLVP